MSILKLKPSCKDYLWGGQKLSKEYGLEYDGEVLAEGWMLSCHPDGPSYIENGIYKSKTLEEFIELEGKSVLGTNCNRFQDFPILTKFIDAKENLSIQVHPSNQYALKNEGQYGKTEMWYVMDAAPEAFLYYGFKKEITKEEFAKRIEEDTLLEVLNAVPVQKGDVLFIEAGTIHAIGKDILIAEIQQNSNITYRVYDYGRVGKDGKKRDLHIEKALAVTNRVPIVRAKNSYPHVADCDYFTVDKLNLDGTFMKKMEGYVSDASFESILVLDGNGSITCNGETLSLKKGDSFFLSAGSGEYSIEGYCDALVTTIREKADSVCETFQTLQSNKKKIGHFTLVQDEVLVNGKRSSYDYLEMIEGVSILALHNDCVVTLREYRYPIRSWQIELPGGLIDSGETPKQAAIRELKEETGYQVAEITSLGCFYPSFGSTNEKIHLFAVQCAELGLEDKEETEVLYRYEIPIQEFQHKIASGEFQHGAGLAAWARYQGQNHMKISL